MTKEELTRIYELALEGKTNREIGEKLYYDEALISSHIRKLKDNESKFYNLELYEKIKQERNNRKKVFMTDEKIAKIIDLIYAGKCKLEIAVILKEDPKNITKLMKLLKTPTSCYYKVNHQEIIDKLLENDTKTKDEYYTLIDRLIKEDEKNGKYIKNYNIYKSYKKRQKVAKMLRAYIDSGYTLCDQRLATDYDLNKSTVAEILCGRSEAYDLKEFATSEEIANIYTKRKEALKEIRKEQQKITGSFFSNKLSKKEKKVLNSIYDNYMFWIQILFTFRLTIEEFARLLNFNDPFTLYKILLDNCNELINYDFSLKSLFATVKPNEKKVKKAKEYLKYLETYQDNPEKTERLLSFINDYKYYNIINKGKRWNELTKEEKDIIIKYRIKYFLPYDYIPYRRENLLAACSEEQRVIMDTISKENENMRRNKKFKNRK